MTRPPLYIVRHGLTDWNVERRLQGQADTDINDVGRSQADRNGHRLAELIDDPAAFDFVASPLRRTRETMERVRLAMGLAPEGYRTDPRLVEVHFGDWQGFTYAELEARQPGVTQARSRQKWHFVPPGAGAESYAMLTERVKPWLDEIERPTVCVTHGGIIRVIFHLVAGTSPERAAAMDVRQDRILHVEDGMLEWL
ncbi:putative phosphoglycerate mutase [Mesorhizobium sp. J18]|uniref:histidine phosphatase family protein n=1 Tax=Mesorhizobium sp. J18 TaxID=935263 RepID=UPI0011996E17|nr:histidine phosphatase family protein [Mesorhizobium sp. J18]TWG89624.1 putative phosphoglycerate mutase [Mesorhizobium sp. J18]